MSLFSGLLRTSFSISALLQLDPIAMDIEYCLYYYLLFHLVFKVYLSKSLNEFSLSSELSFKFFRQKICAHLLRQVTEIRHERILNFFPSS